MSLDFVRLQTLVHDESEFLDSGQYQDWLNLFTEDGIYWVPRSSNQLDPYNEVSLFYEDRAFLEMRVNRLQHPHIHSASVPYRVSHVIGPVRLLAVDEEKREARLQSRFHMQEFHDGRERHFAGRFIHDIVLMDGQLKIRMKRVDLVNCDAVFEPIEIPI